MKAIFRVLGLRDDDGRPWSAVSLTLIALFLLGAPVIAVRNLGRLGILDQRSARFYSWGTAVLMACLMVLVWSFSPRAFIHDPQGQVAPIAIGSPIVVFMLLAGPFRRWRVANGSARPRPWYTAVLPAVGLSFLTVLMGIILISVFAAIFHKPQP